MNENSELAIKQIAKMAVEGHGATGLPLNIAKDVNLVEIGGKIHNLKEHMPSYPARKRAVITITSILSYVQYINDHKEDNHTALFFDVESGKCHGIIDYHEQSQSGKAQFNEHRANLTLVKTESWMDWSRNDGEWKTQEDFAQLIESMMIDIVKPDAADVLEMTKGLEATGKMNFKSAVSLEDGNRELVYENTISAKAPGSIEIPKSFELGIAPFIGADKKSINARFMYRVRDGEVRMSYKLIRPKQFLIESVEEAAALVEKKTNVPVYVGTAPQLG